MISYSFWYFRDSVYFESKSSYENLLEIEGRSESWRTVTIILLDPRCQGFDSRQGSDGKS